MQFLADNRHETCDDIARDLVNQEDGQTHDSSDDCGGARV